MFSVFNLDSMGVKSTFYSKAIENNALDGCPGIEKEGRLLSEAKGHGERERL